MSDMDWPEVLPEPGSMIVAVGFSARSLDASGAVLVSGDIDAGIAAIAPGAPLLGLLEDAPDLGAFALCIARDRALLYANAPLDIAMGWHEAGFAASAADDLYMAFRLEGDRAKLILAALIGETRESPSAMIRIGDSACLVSRAGRGFDIRVPRAEAAALWGLVSRLADAI